MKKYNYVKVADRQTAPIDEVEKITREISEKDLVFCNTQGEVFRAAVARGIPLRRFVPMYMVSRVTVTMDHNCSQTSVSGNLGLALLLSSPMLLETPDGIVDAVLLMNRLPGRKAGQESIAELLANGNLSFPDADDEEPTPPTPEEEAYAYWLGYIYRYEALLHGESTRSIIDELSESFMRSFYECISTSGGMHLPECAMEVCQRIDMLKNQ